MEEITVRDIIRETQCTIDKGPTFRIEGGARVLHRLKQLEKRIKNVNVFLSDNNIGSASSLKDGIVFALKKILGE